MFGCLNLRTKKFYWKSSQQGNSAMLILFFHQLMQTFSGKKIIIITDNASIHKSKKVKQFLIKYPNIKLFYLPTYSPEYNPVEKIWWWVKPLVYGLYALNGGVKELLKRFRKLVYNYNTDRLIDPIDLKLEVYKDIINFNAD